MKSKESGFYDEKYQARRADQNIQKWHKHGQNQRYS